MVELAKTINWADCSGIEKATDDSIRRRGGNRVCAQFLRYWVWRIRSSQMKARLKNPTMSSKGRSPLKRKLVQNRFRSEPKMMMVPAVETRPKPIDKIQRMMRRVVIDPLSPHCMSGTGERQVTEPNEFPPVSWRKFVLQSKTPHWYGEHRKGRSNYFYFLAALVIVRGIACVIARLIVGRIARVVACLTACALKLIRLILRKVGAHSGAQLAGRERFRYEAGGAGCKRIFLDLRLRVSADHYHRNIRPFGSFP